MNCILQNIQPARGREIHAEWIHAFYNWQAFLEPLRINLSGLAILEHEQDVNFSFRMVIRADISKYEGFEKWMSTYCDAGEDMLNASFENKFCLLKQQSVENLFHR